MRIEWDDLWGIRVSKTFKYFLIFCTKTHFHYLHLTYLFLSKSFRNCLDLVV
jgi:hypothetical protein